MVKTKGKVVPVTPDRLVVEKVSPKLDDGQFAIKRTVGDEVKVSADVLCDGHEKICAAVKFKPQPKQSWSEVGMMPVGNDRFQASFFIEDALPYQYTVIAWIDSFSSWRDGFIKKVEANQDVKRDIAEGKVLLQAVVERSSPKVRSQLKDKLSAFDAPERLADLVEAIQSAEVSQAVWKYQERRCLYEYTPHLEVWVDREKARFSSWYEMFPRSSGSSTKQSGTFKDAIKELPRIAAMGFDVLYLPPIHPIGSAHRKGKNNSLQAEKDDPGSPWAIGSADGGHKAVHPELGTLEDFKLFCEAANKLGLEVALDFAIQCSPDHPYVKDHPDWFYRRPDGSIHYAENPPKKYQDIYPINFESEDWENLWTELKSIIVHWVEHGVKIFRVDNPHTKPFSFWAWAIGDIKKKYPEVIFLSEAFTRPKVMYQLAKLGFTQSYTYFTWRNTKHELVEYLSELTSEPVCDFFRPNFFANTPDILPPYLQQGGRPAFEIRLILAATLSSSYGIYSGYELCESEAIEGREEYLNSEKYEIKHRNWGSEKSIEPLITTVNQIRREHSALQETSNLIFCETTNDRILAYFKRSRDGADAILVVVNLDPFEVHESQVEVPLSELGLSFESQYAVTDLLTGSRYTWQGRDNYVLLDPNRSPAHIFEITQNE